MLQKKIEKSMGSQIHIEIQQQMGVFQASMLEAFNKLLEQQKFLRNEIKSGTSVAKPPSDSMVDQIQNLAKASNLTCKITI